MIQTGIKIEPIVEFLRKNLSIIIVVPAFIGGIWQAVELMNIDYSYIRFFSISQIVPDGILILIIIGVVLSFELIGWYGDTLFFEKKKKDTINNLTSEDYEKYRKKELVQKTSIFVFSYVFFILHFLDCSNFSLTIKKINDINNFTAIRNFYKKNQYKFLHLVNRL